MSADNHWGRSITRMRKALGISAYTLANEVGCHEKSIRLLEDKPEIPTRSKYAQAVEDYLRRQTSRRAALNSKTTIDDDVLAAEKSGLTYGRWKMEHYWI